MNEKKEKIEEEKAKSNRFTRNKWLITLAFLLLLITVVAVSALVALGLFLSFWSVIPAVLLFSTVLVVGKIFYDERKLKPNGNTLNTNKNVFYVEEVNFDPNEIKNAEAYDPIHKHPLSFQDNHLSNSPRVDNLKAIKKLNFILIGKPEAILRAEPMFCTFAKSSKKDQDVDDFCILRDFQFNEEVAISLFKVTTEEIEAFKNTHPTLKLDAGIITVFIEKSVSAIKKGLDTEEEAGAFDDDTAPEIPPQSQLTTPEKFKLNTNKYEKNLFKRLESSYEKNLFKRLESKETTLDEEYTVTSTNDECECFAKLNHDHTMVRETFIMSEADSKKTQEIRINDNNQVIRNILTKIITEIEECHRYVIF